MKITEQELRSLIRSVISEASKQSDKKGALVSVLVPDVYSHMAEDVEGYNVTVKELPNGSSFLVRGTVDDLDGFLDDITIGDRESQEEIWLTSKPRTEIPGGAETDVGSYVPSKEPLTQVWTPKKKGFKPSRAAIASKKRITLLRKDYVLSVTASGAIGKAGDVVCDVNGEYPWYVVSDDDDIIRVNFV